MARKDKKTTKDNKASNTIKSASTANNSRGVKAVKLNSKFTTVNGKVVSREELLKATTKADFCIVYTNTCTSHDTANDRMLPSSDQMITGVDIKKALDAGFIDKTDLTPVQYKAIKKIRLSE